MAIEKDLLDQLLAGRDPKDVFNKDGLVDELKSSPRSTGLAFVTATRAECASLTQSAGTATGLAY